MSLSIHGMRHCNGSNVRSRIQIRLYSLCYSLPRSGYRLECDESLSPTRLLSGIDDAYLMVHSWHRVTSSRRLSPVHGDSPESRLAAVMADTGPAILISALTNILADLVGTYTGAPEITLLAYANMVCIAVDFFYQVRRDERAWETKSALSHHPMISFR